MFRSFAAAIAGRYRHDLQRRRRRRRAVLYGLVDAAASRSRPPGGEYRYQLDSGDMSRSFIGFRGAEDLGGGLRAVFKLESYLQHRHRRGRAATPATPSGAATRTSACRARSAPPCSAATSRRSTWPPSTSIRSAIPSRSRRARASTTARSARSATGAGTTRSSYTNNTSDSPLRVSVAANRRKKRPGTPDRSQLRRQPRLHQRPVRGDAGHRAHEEHAAAGAARLSSASCAYPGRRVVRLQVHAHLRPGRPGQGRRRDRHAHRALPDRHRGAVRQRPDPGCPTAARRRARRCRRSPTGPPSIGYDYFLSKSTDIYVAAMREKTFMLSAGGTLAGGVRLRF